jgi:hypothetical protein
MKARSGKGQAPASGSRQAASGPVSAAGGGFQTALGNRMTLALLGAGPIQTKLRLGGQGDPLEREADRVADAVVAPGAAPPRASLALTAPSEKRKTPGGAEGEEVEVTPVAGATSAPPPVAPPQLEEEPQSREQPEPGQEKAEEEEPPIQAMLHAGGAPAAAAAPPPLAGGSPLAAESRAFFEPRLGARFGDVRVHTGVEATAGARSLGARAYTRGHHIAFDRGEYAPRTPRGRRLLAHELAHVVQQSAAPPLDAAATTAPSPDLRRPAEVRERLGAGRPLQAGVRSRMERALGGSFAGVRLHTDATAGRLAGQLDAAAFAVGAHVAFAPGRYRPGTLHGDALLAHELAHTLQQGRATTETPGAAGGAADNVLEREADGSASRAAAALWAPGLGSVAGRARPRRRSGLRLSRCGATTEKDAAKVGKHTTVNFILKRFSPKRSNTDPSTVKLKDQSFSASVVEDKPGKQWKYRLDSVDSKGEMQIVYYTEDHYPAPTPTDDSGALSNVTSGNWKTIVDDLEKNKEGVADFWSAYKAEDVHEGFHWRQEWQVDAKKELATAEADIDKLSVSQADAADAGAAEAKLKGPATAAFNAAVARARATFADDDSPGDAPYKAQAPVVQALADRVKAHAAAKKWP